MIINTTVQIEDENGDAIKVDAEGRFHHGSLEDWYIDSACKIDDSTAEYVIAKLYQEYEEQL